ncbi:MAG: hypothetical protein HY749_06320 [Gammaproteobacteria bacterium]|nr:hypothetical protein [Gammaproteobacteria bacterium]
MTFGGLAPAFSAAFAMGYAAAMLFGITPFSYYPALQHFSLTALSAADAGPPILWYGWIAFGCAGGVGAATIALAMPRRWQHDLWPVASWLMPIAATVVLIYHARVWFM